MDDRSGLEQWFGPTADEILSSPALTVDRDSRDRLLVEICRAVNDGLERLVRHAESDYAPDPKADRFPDVSVATEKAGTSSATRAPQPLVSLKQLLADWWIEAKALGRTRSTRHRKRLPFWHLACCRQVSVKQCKRRPLNLWAPPLEAIEKADYSFFYFVR